MQQNTVDHDFDATNHVIDFLTDEWPLFSVLPILYIIVSTSPVVDAICQTQFTYVEKSYRLNVDNCPITCADTCPFLMLRLSASIM